MDKDWDKWRTKQLSPEHRAGGDSKREDLCRQDSERVTKTTPGASSSRQLGTPRASSCGRPFATEDSSSEKKVHLHPHTDGEQYIKKVDDLAKSFKPRSEEEHEIHNQIKNSVCARLGNDPNMLQDFRLNVAIWSQSTSDCLWASSWLTKDREDFKRMAMSRRFPSTQDLTVCATRFENIDRSQWRIQDANSAGLELISMVKKYAAWRSISMTDQNDSSCVLRFHTLC